MNKIAPLIKKHLMAGLVFVLFLIPSLCSAKSKKNSDIKDKVDAMELSISTSNRVELKLQALLQELVKETEVLTAALGNREMITIPALSKHLPIQQVDPKLQASLEKIMQEIKEILAQLKQSDSAHAKRYVEVVEPLMQDLGELCKSKDDCICREIHHIIDILRQIRRVLIKLDFKVERGFSHLEHLVEKVIKIDKTINSKVDVVITAIENLEETVQF